MSSLSLLHSEVKLLSEGNLASFSLVQAEPWIKKQDCEIQRVIYKYEKNNKYYAQHNYRYVDNRGNKVTNLADGLHEVVEKGALVKDWVEI